MPRMKKLRVYDEAPLASSWAQWRAENGLAPTLRIREPGRCYDCGEVLQPGPCGGWHSRSEVIHIQFCCACRGCHA